MARRPSNASPTITLEDLLPGGNGAVLIEHSFQFISNIGCITLLDVTALHHMDELALSKQCERRRGGRISSKIRARPLCRFEILTGKNAQQAIGPRRILQSGPHC